MDKTMVLDRFKNALSPFEQKVRAFTYTDFYLALVCAIVFIAWVSKCAPFGFAALILLSCFILLLSDDMLPLSVNIFAAVLMIFDNKIETFLYLWPFFIPLGLAIAVFVVRNFKKKFRFGKMFFPQLAVSFALLFGGVGVVSREGYVRALPTVLFLGIGVLAVYVLFNMFLKRDEKRDLALYYAKMMAMIGTVVCLELLIVIIRSGAVPAEWSKFYFDVGWGNRNNIATYLLFTAPMCLYLSTRYKQGWTFILLGLAQYACLILTFSRGGIIFGAVGGVCAFAFTIVKAPERKRMLIYWGVIIAVCLIAYFCVMQKVNALIASLVGRGMGSSGRDLLYFEAWDLFKAHPFQGVGMGYVGSGPCPISDMNMYLFHSTLFQVLADMGIVGVLCYGFYYVVRCIILFKDIKHKFNLFMLAVWIGFEGYSMIDTGTIVPFPNMILIIVGTLLLERLAGNGGFEGYVDEYNSTLAYAKTLFGKKSASDGEVQPAEALSENVEASQEKALPESVEASQEETENAEIVSADGEDE